MFDPLSYERAMELTILMLCLREALTIETCIRKAQTLLVMCGVGSTDGSPRLASSPKGAGHVYR
jgi:hypothetical protein